MPYREVNRHALPFVGQAYLMNKPAKRTRSASAGRAAPAPAPRAVRAVVEAPVPAPAPDAASLGGRLVICRLARNLKQRACAKAVGITPQSWGDLEAGRSKMPASDTLLEMRDRLGFDPDYVVRGRGMPLLPNFEDLAREQALVSIFRELKAQNKETALQLVQGLRRAQGDGPSTSDPFQFEPPKVDN